MPSAPALPHRKCGSIGGAEGGRRALVGAGSWESWDRIEWNRRLVEEYFGRSGDDDEPVRRLDVSWASLARLTGDRLVDPEAVRERFLERVRVSLGDESIIAAAVSKSESYGGIPGYFIYLFTTCLAASDPQEDLENEGQIELDFLEALCTMLGDPKHGGSVERLPEVWERFAAWTRDAESEGSYRSLVLPDPGNENRIGYSKRLVFPRVRDQRVLARLLEEVDLPLEDPPIDLLISRLRPKKTHMSGELQDAYEELVTAWEIDQPLVGDNRFLHAVNATVRNAALLAGGGLSAGPVTMLLYDYGDSFTFDVATLTADAIDGFEITDVFPPPWRYRISVGSGESAVEILLRGEPRLSSLSWVVGRGVIPFTALEDGVREVARISQRGRLEDVCYVLIRDDRVETVCHLLNIDVHAAVSAGLEGWSVIRVAAGLRQYSVGELRDHGLDDVLVLHPRPLSNSLRFHGGFGAGRDFLGFRSILPTISAPGAVEVVATLDGTPLAISGGQGRWKLPDREDLFGVLEVRASYATGNLLRKTTNLIDEPDVLAYKAPARPGEWMQETLAGTSMAERAELVNVSETDEEIPDGMHRVYLGGVVGEFLPNRDGAVFELTSFGGIRSARLIEARVPEPPSSRVEDRGTCRAWRRLLDEYAPHAVDEVTAQAMRRARSAVENLRTLAVVVSDRGQRPPASSPEPYPGCRLTMAAIGAFCARRAGMQVRDWNELLEQAFGIDPLTRRFVHRAWVEAGLIDELRQTQWRGVSVFARRPTLATFRVGEACFGSVDGLVMRGPLARLCERAETLGLSVSMNPSPSRFLPERLMVMSSEPNRIDEYAAAVGLEVRRLTSQPTSDVRMRDLERAEIVSGYVTRRAWPTFSPPAGVSLIAHHRADAPMFWSASFEGRSVWSYSPEAVSFWARRALGLEVARLGEGGDVEPEQSFLPLSIARWLAVVSGKNPGPRPDGRYVNPAASRNLAQRTIRIVESLSSKQIAPGERDD